MDQADLFSLRPKVASPVTIASIEILRWREHHFVRTRATDGAEGVTITNVRGSQLHAILKELVAPYFIGKDARDIESLVDGVYRYELNYKLAGPAFWMPVAWIEFSILDLLGKVARRPVGELLGGVKRREIPVYISSLKRDTTPEEEVAWLSKRLAETGAKAVKIKVGGRLSSNEDASPGRSRRLVSLARKTWGDGVRIFVDANGSYTPEYAIEVAAMLRDHNVAFFEEPCPFEDLEATRQVADALEMPVAGGEQESRIPSFEWMARNRGVDILQPDLAYNGGIIRAHRVAAIGREYGLPLTPHTPYLGPLQASAIQLAATLPEFPLPLEQNAVPPEPATWYSPDFEIRNGAVTVPTGDGFGVEYDPAVFAEATVI